MEDEDLLEQIESHLRSPSQSWLLGAGASVEAGIPLMHPLTSRVRALLEGDECGDTFDALSELLPEGSHIEHILNQLTDYIALTRRSRLESGDFIEIHGHKFTEEHLQDAHAKILEKIAQTVKYGYKPAQEGNGADGEEVGSVECPIVTIDRHQQFVKAVCETGQAGLQSRRGPINLFTTNYDTLLEDSLALSRIEYWDGFSGGAVAFRNYRFGDAPPLVGQRANVVKMHGSIDWHMDESAHVWRVRENDRYPSDKIGRVVIYPQATKYLATQRDPFSVQFDLFRRAFITSDDNVLCICGYSFGDEHINEEIATGMSRPESRTTLIIFIKENEGLPHCLDVWRKAFWGNRLFILTEKGVYKGPDGPFCEPKQGSDYIWWTFSGVIEILESGVGHSS